MALKGRNFDAIGAQNAHLAHWKQRWATARIPGRKMTPALCM
jgi:hypothetical protein